MISLVHLCEETFHSCIHAIKMKTALLDVLFMWILLIIVSNSNGEGAQWSSWSEWSRCSKERSGIKSRARACYNDAGQAVQDCQGERDEYARCSTCPGALKLALKPSLVERRLDSPVLFTCHFRHNGNEQLRLGFSLSSDEDNSLPETKNYIQQTDNACGSTIKWKVQLHPETAYVRCTLRDALGGEVGSLVTKIVQGVAPEITVFRESVTVPEGHGVSFHCRVIKAHPTPNIHWSRADGKPLPATVKPLASGELRFNRVTKADIGQYICNAENFAGKATANATLKVEIQSLPEITQFPGELIRASVGDHISLECRASGTPEPFVIWFKDGTAPASRMETQNVAMLEIASVGKGDEGTYKCVASNSLGAISGKLQLIVHENYANTRNQRRNNNSADVGNKINETLTSDLNKDSVNSTNENGHHRFIIRTTEAPEFMEPRTSRVNYYEYSMPDQICNVDQYQCANMNCIWKGGHCDGVKDCDDNSDEMNCATSSPRSRCTFNQFRCSSGQCVHLQFKCDCERDCVDGSDETDCDVLEMIKKCET